MSRLHYMRCANFLLPFPSGSCYFLVGGVRHSVHVGEETKTLAVEINLDFYLCGTGLTTGRSLPLSLVFYPHSII